LDNGEHIVCVCVHVEEGWIYSRNPRERERDPGKPKIIEE
jgi:hypothetical protein